MFELTFRFENNDTPATVSVTGEETVLETARDANVPIDAPCSGNGACGKCRVKLLSGEVSALPNACLSDGWYLACGIRPCSDVTVLVPDIASAYRRQMKTADLSTAEEVAVFEALLAKIRAAGISLTAPSTKNTTAPYALAIDIGTTTVCAVLFDPQSGALLAKASCGNAQIRYGADVINRIIEQGKPGGNTKLRDAIVKETLMPLIAALCDQADISGDRIGRIGIACNPTMNHLLLGVDANCIRTEPYLPAFYRRDGLTAADLELPVYPAAPICLAPNIGSFVGGDITAGVFAAMFWDSEALSLFIDLGTNGEIVFGNRDFLIACACSAGPAFEGGDISCGMRAVDGAIEAVSIDEDTMRPTLTVIGAQKPVGICGSGLIDLVAELFRCGIINAKGRFIREGDRIAYDRHGTGRYILAAAEASATGREIALNEVDILNFIRAKGAIYAAIDTVLSALDMDESAIAQVFVAGGIGSGINLKNAVRIGMLPNVPAECFRYVGNTALAGAYAMALSPEAERKIDEIARNMTYLELSTHPGYMEKFIAACFLPHTDAGRFQAR